MEKEKIKLFLAIGSFIASIVIGLAGFYVPPTGEINSSVLYYTAQLLIFCATLLGLSINFDYIKDLAKSESKKDKK